MALPLDKSDSRNVEQLAARLGPLLENVRFGNGDPEGTIKAGVGAVYMRLDGSSGSTLYTKESGTESTGWAAAGSGGGGGFTTEDAQDAVGAMLTDTTTVDLTYVDATPALSADVIAGSLTNTHVSASAAIDVSKLGNVSTGAMIVGNSTGTAWTTAAPAVPAITGYYPEWTPAGWTFKLFDGEVSSAISATYPLQKVGTGPAVISHAQGPRGGLLTWSTGAVAATYLNPGASGSYLHSNGVSADLDWRPISEDVDDRVNALIQVQGALTKVYDDTAGTLLLSVLSTSAGHNMLSESHLDAEPDTALRGDIIVAQGAQDTWADGSQLPGVDDWETGGNLSDVWGPSTRWTRLALGATGTVLTSDGTDAAWAAPATHALLSTQHSDTLAGTVTRGDLIVGNATPKWAELAVGTTGQYLGTDGTDVSWRAQSTLDHGSIGGLTDDDHAQYALLAGRAGGQTLYGGTAASDDLILESTFNATKGDIKMIVGTSVFVETPTSLTGTTNTAMQIGNGQTVTLGAGGGVRAMGFLPNIDIAGDPTGVMALLFGFSSTVTLGSNAAYDLNGTRIFTNQPTYNMSSGITYGSLGSGATLPMTGFWDGPSYVDAAGGATGTVDNVTSFRQGHAIGTGWTITTDRGLHVLAATGTGTIGTHVGVDVEDLDTFATLTTPISLRSIGTVVQMRHAGPGVFGANAAPTNASIALEVQSTTQAFMLPRMTNAQIAAIATAADGMLVYCTDAGALAVGAHQRIAGAWQAI
jgi:hypothetical protein